MSFKVYPNRGGKEQKVHGKYYEKNVDVAISREDIILGVVSVKFVMSNYNQNKHNYFEQQLGETANLRSNNIVYGHIMLRTQPTPYLGKDQTTGKQVVKKNEQVQIVRFSYIRHLLLIMVQTIYQMSSAWPYFNLVNIKEKYFGYAINPIYLRFLLKALSYFVVYLELIRSLIKFVRLYTVNMS